MCLCQCVKVQQRDDSLWNSQSKLQMFLLVSAAMLVPLWRNTNMASHIKLCNFPRYRFSNNSIMRYRTALCLSHVVYVSLFYNISISWLYLLNVWGFYSFTCVTMCDVKTTNSVTFPDNNTRHRPPKLKLWAMIILRNGGHGANIRVCMGIFTIGFRRYKYWKVLNKNDIPCF